MDINEWFNNYMNDEYPNIDQLKDMNDNDYQKLLILCEVSPNDTPLMRGYKLNLLRVIYSTANSKAIEYYEMAINYGNYDKLNELLTLCKNNTNKTIEILTYVFENNTEKFEQIHFDNFEIIKELIKNSVQQKQETDELMRHNKALMKQNIDLKTQLDYAPNGNGYFQALEDFTQQAIRQKIKHT